MVFPVLRLVETSHLICSARQVIGSYAKPNPNLNLVKRNSESTGHNFGA